MVQAQLARTPTFSTLGTLANRAKAILVKARLMGRREEWFR
jgi:hypothetical protein